MNLGRKSNEFGIVVKYTLLQMRLRIILMHLIPNTELTHLHLFNLSTIAPILIYSFSREIPQCLLFCIEGRICIMIHNIHIRHLLSFSRFDQIGCGKCPFEAPNSSSCLLFRKTPSFILICHGNRIFFKAIANHTYIQ